MKYILDIGSGNKPNPKANIFLERYICDNVHRCGKKAVLKEGLIIGDACHLPFKNKSIEIVYSNHLIEHLDDPDGFLNETNRVGKQVKHTAPGIIHHIHGELLFGGVGIGIHKYVWNPVTKDWISVEYIRKSMQKYSSKQKLYLALIRLLPSKLRHMIFSTYIYIIDEYLKNIGIDIVEYEYTKDGDA